MRTSFKAIEMVTHGHQSAVVTVEVCKTLYRTIENKSYEISMLAIGVTDHSSRGEGCNINTLLYLILKFCNSLKQI